MADREDGGTGPVLRVVVYVRISDDPLGLERGVDRQEADCRALAQEQGWRVVEVFRENDTSAFAQRTIRLDSGEKVRRVVRPGFRAVLRFLSEGKADVLVVYDLDRAVRDPRDLEDLIDARTLYGFRVRSVTGSLRLDSDSDVAMARVLVAMANKSSADTARRVARAKKQVASEGKRSGGQPPFGYQRDGLGLVIDPVTSVLLREAVDRTLAGDSLYKIRCDWNDRGLRTPHGKLWNECGMKRILQNPAIIGLRTHRPVKPDGSRDLEPTTVVRGCWEPILDQDTWDQVQQVLASRSRKSTWDHSLKRVYPFSGLIRCSACGVAMRKNAEDYVCLPFDGGGCYRGIVAKDVQQVIEDAVLTVFRQIALKPGTPPAPVPDTGLESLTALVDADKAMLERLDDDHYDGLIDKQTWVRQRARLVQRVAARQKQWADAQPTSVLGTSIDVATVADQWHGRTPAWQHDAASLILEAVLIHAHPKGVATTISWRRGKDTPETYYPRLRAYREKLLAQRIEFIWKN